MRLTGDQTGKPLRVMHLPWNVGGHAAGLARAERALGADSVSIALEPGRYGFEADEVVTPSGASAFSRETARWRLLNRALAEADVVHFNWGETLFSPPPPGFLGSLSGPSRSRLAMAAAMLSRKLFSFHDLRKLKRAGKVIAVTFQGDDIRQGDRLRKRYEHSLADVVEPGYYSPETDEWKRKRIAAFSAHADIIYALNPDLLLDLPERARFLPYASVEPDEVKVAPQPAEIFRITHAPSHRGVKGTEQIIAAVETVRATGRQVELDLVEDTSHSEALGRYANASIAIDQLNAGFYGSFAVEAMALGKPVLCYLREEDVSSLPPEFRQALPVENVTAETLVSKICQLYDEDRSVLAERRLKARRFAELWHAPREIARTTLSDYESVIRRRSKA